MTRHLILLLFGSIIPTTTWTAAADTDTVFPIQISARPRIFIYDGIFSHMEAKTLRDIARPQLTTAGTMNFQGETHQENKFRDASVTGVHPDPENPDNDIVVQFRQRMALAALAPEEHGEILQVTRYTTKQKYEIHFDSSLVAGRVATVLAFLSVPEHGGELAFPWAVRGQFVDVNPYGVSGKGRPVHELKHVTKEPPAGPLCTNSSNSLLIKPQIGRVVVWFNHDTMLRREGYWAMHAGCPVLSEDEKWIAQLWIKWHLPLYEPNIFAQTLQDAGLDWKL